MTFLFVLYEVIYYKHKYLKGKSERDWLLCKFQLNTGLRISDVISIQVHNLITEQYNFKDYYIPSLIFQGIHQVFLFLI